MSHETERRSGHHRRRLDAEWWLRHAALIAALEALEGEWRADIDDCAVCSESDQMPCEVCRMTARHLGALKGTLLRQHRDGLTPAPEETR